ncbi:thioredoxin [Blastocystis sp. subtype 4]|uniref:thioredoxin n=1 Tax=Blastocystis sp. subtype 4 TaxID=944170 RepID=UPI000711DE83|nr:thioredoxin [Blastocystis sp. subtype 4]KNB44687.1 thioredoxin [Blastocystis sp. subtype 4]|eukprot:XP_014528130.1 thioredoxin [Blastocystis sp. subtype 4]
MCLKRLFSAEESDNVIDITTMDMFDEYKKAAIPSISFFTSKKSDSCRKISPLFSHFSTMVPTVTFLKVDIADNEALSKVEKVEEVPTFILYKNGQLLSRVKDYSGLKV